MTSENRETNAREEMARGNEALTAAEQLVRVGLWNDAVSRAYYAAYHWARALLFLRGLESKTHRGVIQLIGLHFVREKRLPEEAAQLLARLEDAREASDYSASVRFTEEEARHALSQAQSFIALCGPLMPST